MGRGKLGMKLISNEKSRKTTFTKREKSLMRKAYELSTLCDVRACVFVYGPNYNDKSPAQVHTWPTCRDEVNDMIASYKATCLHKRARKAFNLLDFFSERKKKIESDMSKLRKDVVEARFSRWNERLDYLSEDQLRLVLIELDSKLDSTNRRMEVLTENLEDAGTSKHKQEVVSFEDQSYNNMFGSSSSMEPQALIPFHHQYHHHHHHQMTPQNLQMDHHYNQQLENNLSHQFNSSTNRSLQAQIHFNYGNNYCFPNPNFYSDPTTNGMIMDNTQNYSMCHYGVPTQSIMPLSSYMQLSDDQMMMANASAAQVNDQFDYFNYEYFMKINNF